VKKILEKFLSFSTSKNGARKNGLLSHFGTNQFYAEQEEDSTQAEQLQEHAGKSSDARKGSLQRTIHLQNEERRVLPFFDKIIALFRGFSFLCVPISLYRLYHVCMGEKITNKLVYIAISVVYKFFKLFSRARLKCRNFEVSNFFISLHEFMCVLDRKATVKG